MDFGSVGFPLGGPFSPAGTTTFTGGFITGTANTYTGAATLTLTDTGVAPGTYSNPTITVDSKGRITVASSGATSTFKLIGDVTGGSGSNEINVTLASTGVSSGTYDRVTVDSKGRVTAGFGMPSSGVVAGYYSNPDLQIDAFGRVVSAANGMVGSDTLPDTGVAAGSYSLASITVDAKGRITAASNGVAEVDPELPAGGIAGQALVKTTGADYDVKWATLVLDEAEAPDPVDPITIKQFGGQATQAYTTVSLPSQSSVSNIVLAMGTHASNYTGNPTGWNLIAAANASNTDGVYAAWFQPVSAGSSYVPFQSPTTGNGSSVLVELTGLNMTSPVDVEQHAVDGATSATTHVNTITTDLDRTVVVGFVSAYGNNTSPNSISGVTRGPSYVGGNRSIHLFYTFVEDAGTTVTITSTWPSSVRVAYQAVSLRQATATVPQSNWTTPEQPFNGIYMRTPDGSVYNLHVANGGTVAATLVV